MLLKLEGFKCYVDNNFEFPDKGTTLLNGASGQGKTTLLQSISWALYGGMRGVENNTGSSKKCAVTFKYDNITVYRQKKPNLLRITVNNKIYENEVAQEMINKKFTSKELWYTCCYIEQKQRCALLSGSTTERMEILNKLSFNDEKPEKYIEKISEKYSIVDKEFNTLKSKLEIKNSIYEKDLHKRKPKKNIILPLNDIQKNITNEQENIKNLQKIVYEYQKSLGIKSHLNNEISKLQLQLSKIPDTINCPNSDDFNEAYNNMKTRHLNLINCKNLINELNNLNKDLNNLENDILKYDEILKDVKCEEIPSNELIWKIKQIEKDYEYGINECKKLNIKFDQNVIDDNIKILQEELSFALNLDKQLDTYNKYKSILNQYNKLEVTHDDIINLNDFENRQQELKKLINECKKGKDSLLCPHCNQYVRYLNSKLVSVDHKPISNEEIMNYEKELNKLSIKINNVRQAQQFENQMNTLLSICGDVKQYENVHRINPSNIQQNLNVLFKIKYVDKPKISSGMCEILYKNHQLNERKLNFKLKSQELIDKISKYDIDTNLIFDEEINNILKEMQNYKQDFQVKCENFKNIQRINKLLDDYQEQLKILPNMNDNCIDLLEESKKHLKNLEMEYDEIMYSNEIISKHSELSKMQEQLIKLEKDKMSLVKLKNTALYVECLQLQDTVDTINIIMNDMLSKFFTEPINVTLSLHKELKTQKNTQKREVNLKISYKGCEYDSVNQLSGGEGDRVSLALILALNNVCSSPFLLLDECMTAFDQSLKEMTIHALKNYPYKNIICVDHSSIEGFYDKTITI